MGPSRPVPACSFHCIGYIQRVLKNDGMVKLAEVRLLDAVRDLVSNVPTVQVDSIDHAPTASQDDGVDGIVGLSCAGGSYALVVAVKSNGAPRFVRSGVYQLESGVARLRQSPAPNRNRRPIPMLVSPYLPPASRAICVDHDLSYLDLAGNARLAFDTVYIERAVAEKPRSEARALRSVFSPRAAAILRTLLREPDRSWRVADLSAEANASYGHVSNVRRALLEREWLESGSRRGSHPAGRPAANMARELLSTGRTVHHRLHPFPWKTT